MGQRLQLQNLLELILWEGDPEEATEEDKLNVYFQPPNGLHMAYPCIVFKRDFAETEFADNKPYANMKRYQVTVIDPNPDSAIPDKIAALPLCSFNRFYTKDNLNHDVYNLFF